MDKPAKPCRDFPLFAHATKRWAKKIRGKLHYFGPWADPDGALQRYLEQRDDLQAGRVPRPRTESLLIRDLLDHFLTAKRHLVDTRRITARTFGEYHATCQRVAAAFGVDRPVNDLVADDFRQLRASMAKTWGPVRLGNEVQRVRSVFKYAYDAGLVDKPVRYGPSFKRPSRRVLRRARHEKGPRTFEADQIRAILETAGAAMKAMVYLAINCAFGNHDVGTLPKKALDLAAGWVDFPRPKTEVSRHCPLWPETIVAIQAALEVRPKPKDESYAGLVFLTKYGNPWAGDKIDNPVTKEMAKILRRLGINRPGLNFYSLRHTFETVAGNSRDQVAVDHIMGHTREDMASFYRERISDDRLRAAVEHVRRWLFSPGA